MDGRVECLFFGLPKKPNLRNSEERILKKLLLSFAMPALALAQLALVTGCDSSDTAGSARGDNGARMTNDSSAGTLPGNGSSGKDPGPMPVGIESCRTKDSEHLCIGIKYVAYKSETGAPSATQAEALQLTRNMNKVWAQCNIAFQLETYQAVIASDHGLTYNTAGFGDQDNIRAAFMDDTRFVIVATGPWNRGNNAVAWTQAPGGGRYGVVADKEVATDTNVIAHELGHYMSLDHVSDSGNLLSPVVYPASRGLDTSQCAAARDSATSYWTHMLR